jgi:predicted MPP superfamily phosphohydrolase
MNLFLITFFLIYGGVHCYAFVKARQALSFGLLPGVLLAFFLLCMVLAPVLVRVAEHRGFEALARFLAYVGYCWMAILFFFFLTSLACDLYRLMLHLGGWITGTTLARFLPSQLALFMGSLIFAVAAAGYGYFEARNIRTERVVVKSPKLPQGENLTIAQLSDVHVGLIVREKRLRLMAAAVRGARPDIIVSTGDLVDGQLDGITPLATVLRELRPSHGMFAVTGNHEHYAGLPAALAFTEACGFRVLRGNSVEINDWLMIAGVDDPAGGGWRRGMRPPQEEQLMASLDPKRFNLFLKHRPTVSEASLGRFDMQLSGHVHKGQLFPFNLLTYLFYPVRTGLNSLSENARLYVSRGTGTWGPPIRFLAPPEVTIIKVVSE